MDKPELKPCPFCGTSDHLHIGPTGSMTSDMPSRPHRVACLHVDHDAVIGPTAYGKQAAIAAWNTRATPAQPDTALVEAIVEAALDVANVVTCDGYYEIDRDAAARAALSAWEQSNG